MGKSRSRKKAARQYRQHKSPLESTYPMQAMSPVAGTVVALNDSLPRNLKREIAPNGLNKPAGRRFRLFVNWGPSGEHRHRVVEKTYRSTLMPYVLFDGKRLVARFIDFKGAGIHWPAALHAGKKTPFVMSDEQETWGLAHLPYAKVAFEASARMQQHGVNTEYPVAIIRINELIDENGEKISVKEAKRRGLIHEDFEPCLYLRGVTEADRLGTITPARQEAFFDAHKKARGWASAGDYRVWLAMEAATNLARIHNSGHVHKYVSDHNILIDGGIVDNGGVGKFSQDKAITDLNETVTALASFAREREKGVVAGSAFRAYLANRKNLSPGECINVAKAAAQRAIEENPTQLVASHVSENFDLLKQFWNHTPTDENRTTYEWILSYLPKPAKPAKWLRLFGRDG